ncbi:MAG: hypothetical protein JXQ82_02245 [Methanomicrobiaceae archaeon]|nr:hypothetical protein [Methanomicrobiaceae archaeon]
MEELPEYQICPRCGKRSTPYMERCWSCGENFYPNPNAGHCDKPEDDVLEKKNEQKFVPEMISPCTLEKMNFTDRMFAYSLLFRGEMIIEFCDCEICKEAFKDTIAFFRELKPDDEEIMKEADDTEIKGMILDISEFGF